MLGSYKGYGKIQSRKRQVVWEWEGRVMVLREQTEQASLRRWHLGTHMNKIVVQATPGGRVFLAVKHSPQQAQGPGGGVSGV